MAEADVTYSVDNVPFSSYGVYVSSSEGVICKPAIKEPLSDDRSWMHGIVYDLSSLHYKEVQLSLRCFIEAFGYDDYITKATTFLAAFGASSGTHTLKVTAGASTFSIGVLCKDSVDIAKTWNAVKFVGTFTLKLTVPNPSVPVEAAYAGGTVDANDVTYYLDGHNFNAYGVYVEGSEGITTLPAIKTPLSQSWGNENGVDYHTQGMRYKERVITLKCFMEGSGYADLLNKAVAFFGLFAKNGTRRLKLTAGGKILVYQVFSKDAITLSPDFREPGRCVGMFTLKLIEPEPVKRVLSGGGSITIKSPTPVNIYWGDGTCSYEVGGSSESVTVTHQCSGETIITGEPDDFISFSSSSSILWSRLL